MMVWLMVLLSLSLSSFAYEKKCYVTSEKTARDNTKKADYIIYNVNGKDCYIYLDGQERKLLRQILEKSPNKQINQRIVGQYKATEEMAFVGLVLEDFMQKRKYSCSHGYNCLRPLTFNDILTELKLHE